MHEPLFLTKVAVLTLLIFIASLSGIISRKIDFPYTIGLLIAGISIGYLATEFTVLAPMQEIQLSPSIILFIILPTLLFDAAINIDSKMLLRNIFPILILATVGLLVSMVIIGVGLSFFTPLSIGTALLFGALISATDPVAVIALFKELGVSEKLSTLVDGESLLNDATAIVVFHILLVTIAGGASINSDILLKGFSQFVLVFFGGITAGLLLGIFFHQLLLLSRGNHQVQTALTTVLAYTAFIVSDHIFDVSGVMAVVTAGIFISWVARKSFDDFMRQYIRELWEYMAFIANSLIFLLLGLTEYKLFEDIGRYNSIGKYILIAFLLTIVARAIVVFGLVPITNKMNSHSYIEPEHKKIMFWGGLRGAIPLALALGLPADFAHRAFIIDLTLGTVLLSLLIQGTTIKPLLSQKPQEPVAIKKGCLDMPRQPLKNHTTDERD